MAIACAIFLATWLLLTAINCINPLANWIRTRDRYKFVPCWLLFTPEVWRGDLRVLYRGTDANGQHVAWREVPWWKKRRRLSFLINPEIRTKIGLIECLCSLDPFLVGKAQGDLREQAGYRVLRDGVQSRCSDLHSVEFVVIHRGLTGLHDKAEIRLRSGFHVPH